MYLRIQEHSIRFRISKLEATNLLEDQTLRLTTQLSEIASFSYQISVSEQPNSFVFQQSENQLVLKINRHSLIKELENRPSKSGIIFEKKILNHNLKISLEIDIKKII